MSVLDPVSDRNTINMLAGIGHCVMDEACLLVQHWTSSTQSPIEAQLLQALCLAGLYEMLSVTCGDDPHALVLPRPVTEGQLRIEPQPQVLNLHPDFRVTLEWFPWRCASSVLVECDGHDFHERTKAQAKRDKQRDRSLKLAGWTVLRFAGSEIYADPLTCAGEIIDHLHAGLSVDSTPTESA